jgi:hypothetical protein
VGSIEAIDAILSDDALAAGNTNPQGIADPPVGSIEAIDAILSDDDVLAQEPLLEMAPGAISADPSTLHDQALMRIVAEFTESSARRKRRELF